MTKVNYSDSSQRVLWVSRAVLCAILTISSMDVFGVGNTKGESTVSEVSQNKTVTSEEAAKIYAELPLHYAVWKRDKKLLLKQIKEHGTEDINEKAENGRTPLIIAAISGDVSIATTLIKNGAEVDLKSDRGTTPLIFAVINNHLNMVKHLIKNNANVNDVDSIGFNALMTAAYKDYLDIVKYLLKNEKVVEDINHQSGKGNTALILAAMKGNADIMQLLIDAGADVNVATNQGKTALSVIKDLNKKLTNMLKKAGATESTSSKKSKSKSTSKKRKIEESEDSEEAIATSDSKEENSAEEQKAKEKSKKKSKSSKSKKKSKSKKGKR